MHACQSSAVASLAMHDTSCKAQVAIMAVTALFSERSSAACQRLPFAAPLQGPCRGSAKLFALSSLRDSCTHSLCFNPCNLTPN